MQLSATTRMQFLVESQRTRQENCSRSCIDGPRTPVNIGHLAISEKSRTGRIGNTRVLPKSLLGSGHKIADSTFDPTWLRWHRYRYRRSAESKPGRAVADQNRPSIKRSVMLERLAAKYPNLSGAISTNDPAFLDSRVPPEHAPGQQERFLLLGEGRGDLCRKMVAQDHPRDRTPPSKRKTREFLTR